MKQGRSIVYSYMPNSVPQVRDQMMKEIGVHDIEELYAVIPENLRFRGSMNLPSPKSSEMELKKHVEGLLSRNTPCTEMTSFLGAGCYQHYVPAICDEINGRSEFLTAYCGEAYSDHGKLQAVFEYTSMMGELLDMDVVSYTTYDGGQAAASSLRMAARITERREILLPRTMNPEIASIIRDYGKKAFDIVYVDFDAETGQIDLADLKRKVSRKTAAVYLENPSYLGSIEQDVREIAEIAHKKGALFVVYADPSSLGVLEAPANYGADITCGEIQGLGMHMQYGGGCAGFIATRDEKRYVDEIPTYLYGIIPSQVKGQYGWGRALNYRTSHASREKAKEYFGTGSGLWAITAGVYLALMGPQGMKELGQTILYNTNYAIEQIGRIPHVNASLFHSHCFQEFVVDFNATRMTVAEVNRRLLEKGIFGGKDLSNDFPDLGQCALYCVTEMTSLDDISKLTDSLKEIVA